MHTPLLDQRTIIVTGAATGIGQAFAVQCASQGANVVVADMNAAGVPATEEDVWRLCERDAAEPAPRLPCLRPRRLRACEGGPRTRRERRAAGRRGSEG